MYCEKCGWQPIPESELPLTLPPVPDYHPNDEGGLMWNDPEIGVEWPVEDGMELILSDKDKVHPGFEEYCRTRGCSK